MRSPPMVPVGKHLHRGAPRHAQRSELDLPLRSSRARSACQNMPPTCPKPARDIGPGLGPDFLRSRRGLPRSVSVAGTPGPRVRDSARTCPLRALGHLSCRDLQAYLSTLIRMKGGEAGAACPAGPAYGRCARDRRDPGVMGPACTGWEQRSRRSPPASPPQGGRVTLNTPGQPEPWRSANPDPESRAATPHRKPRAS